MREVDLGGRKRFHGLTRANFHPAICEGAPNIINVNKRAYKTWVKDTEDAIRGGWHAQSNTILHELGHYIDFCNDPDYFRSVEHEWKMDKADKELIKKQLSEYSLTNRAEFEAELNAAIMRGKVLPKELLSYSHMNNVNTELAKSLLSLGAGEDVCLPSEDISKGFKDAMKVIFNQKGSSFSIDIMADKNVQSLIEAHATVLDRNLQRVEMSDIMRQRLQRSNYIFSGIKTFHELNEAFPSLLDENGNRKPFERFLNDVQKIDDTYNSHYLRTEYNFVQSSAQMAAKWEQFAEDGDRYNLQYRTAGDSKVRPAHAALNGVTLPPSDPFWQTYYPPNGWNCRCTVVQVRKSKYPATPHDEAMKRGEEALQNDTKGIFHFNPGIQQKTIPDYNPYTIRRCNDCDIAKGKIKLAKFIPKNELCAACKLLRSIKDVQYERIEKNRSLYDKLIKDDKYTDVAFDENNGGLKATHIGHNLDKDKGWYETTIQDVGYKHGHSVILEEEPQNVYKGKSCEGLWDDLKFEVAGAESGTSNNIRNALKHCASKPGSKIAVLFFPNGNFSAENFQAGLAKFNGLKGTSQYKKFDLIYCIQGKEIVQIKKPS